MIHVLTYPLSPFWPSALWRKPFWNLELRVLPKLGPWLPFSQARIISDENILMQFHFQFIFGYELKTVFCSSWIAKRSIAMQTENRKIFGTEFWYFCIIQRRFEQIWIENERAVRFCFGLFLHTLIFLISLFSPSCNAAFCSPHSVRLTAKKYFSFCIFSKTFLPLDPMHCCILLLPAHLIVCASLRKHCKVWESFCRKEFPA